MAASSRSFAALGLLVALAAPGAARPQAPAEGAPAPSARVESSVVKVFATARLPDPVKPWTKQSPAERTGSGVVIEGHRILTNAHVVLYASQVQVQGHQAGDKISATVEAIAPGIDLAVLKLDDDGFFETHRALERARTLPGVKAAVMAYGYPTGGTDRSITKGLVSRIEFTRYNFPVSGLRVQIDAAINPGNSGGPAVVDDQMIGLAFSTLGGAQNIGYIIPNEEVDLFLADVADGRYDGKPALFDEMQTLENPALRAYLKLDKATTGIVVQKPWAGEPGNPLQAWDVITRIGDKPIDDQGMIRVGADLRVRFQYLVQYAAVKGVVELGVVRGGKPLTLKVPVSPSYPVMVPDLNGAYPPFFVWGPVVFSTASQQLLSAGGRAAFIGSSLGRTPLMTRLLDQPAFPGEELVVVSSPLLPHKIAKGYGSPQGGVVKEVNGVAVKNLRHLVELLAGAREEFVTLTFAQAGGEALVFRRAEAEATTDELLGDNGIRAQGTPELLAAWSAKRKR